MSKVTDPPINPSLNTVVFSLIEPISRIRAGSGYARDVRYLYADSEPFNYDHNFLETFREFMECASIVMTEADAIDLVESSAHEAAKLTSVDLDSIDAFLRDMLRSITTAKFGQTEAVTNMAEELMSSLKSLADRTKSQRHSQQQTDRRSADQRINESRRAMRKAIEKFFLEAKQKTLESFFHAELTDDSYKTAVEQTLEDKLSVTYNIDTSGTKLSQPVKVSDLVGDLELQIGMKKKWISRDMTREIRRVTDYFIYEIRMSSTQADVRLKKKIDQPEASLILLINKSQNDDVLAEILRNDGSTNGFFAVPKDASKLKQLWSSLQSESARLIDRKASVRALSIDGNDVFESLSEEEVVSRLTDRYIPVINEIARRSPSPNEYSLKLEHPDGKREELYLEKDVIGEMVGRIEGPRSEPFQSLDVIPVIEIIND